MGSLSLYLNSSNPPANPLQADVRAGFEPYPPITWWVCLVTAPILSHLILISLSLAKTQV